MQRYDRNRSSRHNAYGELRQLRPSQGPGRTDLFVDKTARGRGAARALIEQVAAAAREHGATRYYWHTQQDNATARLLYDKVARFSGFIRYERPL